MVTYLALAGAGHFTGALLFYFFHRCIFHGPLRRWPILRDWARIHADHHRNPEDPGAFFFPWWANLMIWSLAVGLFLVSPATGAGLFSFFGLYIYRHRQAHLSSKSRWATHHQSHHYIAPRSNFSAAWPIIDWAFGTYEHFSPQIVEHAVSRRRSRL